MSYMNKREESKIIRYFYSWYLLPIIIYHELSHTIMSYLLFTNVLKFRIFKERRSSLYNGQILTSLPNRKWKQYLISYSPIIMSLIIFTLSIIYPVLIYFSIYLISSIFSYNKRLHWLILPSISDLELIDEYEYQNFLRDKMGKKYNEYRRKGIVEIKRKQKCIINSSIFKQMEKK